MFVLLVFYIKLHFVMAMLCYVMLYYMLCRLWWLCYAMLCNNVTLSCYVILSYVILCYVKLCLLCYVGYVMFLCYAILLYTLLLFVLLVTLRCGYAMYMLNHVM